MHVASTCLFPWDFFRSNWGGNSSHPRSWPRLASQVTLLYVQVLEPAFNQYRVPWY